MRLFKSVACVVLAAFVAVACGKGPAQAALTAADAAVSSARADGEKYAPDQFKGLVTAAASAKAQFDSGDYKGALETAQTVPVAAQAVMQAAVAKKTALLESWKAMEGSLPALVAAIQKKLTELAAAKKLPAGLDKAGLEAATAALDSATGAWAEAGTAFSAGDIVAASTRASEVKTAAEELMTKLGMSPAPSVVSGPAATEPAKK